MRSGLDIVGLRATHSMGICTICLDWECSRSCNGVPAASGGSGDTHLSQVEALAVGVLSQWISRASMRFQVLVSKMLLFMHMHQIAVQSIQPSWRR